MNMPTPSSSMRSPRGCNRPLMAHVTPEERATIDALAKRDERSVSATARLLILRGLEHDATEAPS